MEQSRINTLSIQAKNTTDQTPVELIQATLRENTQTSKTHKRQPKSVTETEQLQDKTPRQHTTETNTVVTQIYQHN